MFNVLRLCSLAFFFGLVAVAPSSFKTQAASHPSENFTNYIETIPGTSLKFEMIAIPGGTFVMGSPDSESGRKDHEGPPHSVTVSPFWMAQTEVSWDEYEEFYFGSNPPGLSTEVKVRVDAVTRPTPPYGAPDLGWGTGQRPAMSMTPYAATRYCEWLSALTGKHYRLPTSAEWEYACRAGSQDAYFFGHDPLLLGEYAWYAGNSREMTQEAAARKPNAWGLFDMLGNVAEFCEDWYAPDDYGRYPPDAWPKDPRGPESGEHRVVRGGSYQDEAGALRCAARERTTDTECLVTDPNMPKSQWWYSDCFRIGFRVVRAAP